MATPIGNLEDLSARAVRVLGEVDAVLAEDTRVSRKLLSHFGIHSKLESFHDHNERGRLAEVVARLGSGQRLAIVSDAGTPLIADPGFALVRACREAGIAVTAIPGPSSITAALSIAGVPTDRFTFLGYVPRKRRAARDLVEELPAHTVILLETPHRIAHTLDLLAELASDRLLVVVRELTKRFEEVVRGTPDDVRREMKEGVRGELVLLLAPAPEPTPRAITDDELLAALEGLVADGLGRREALRELARKTGIRKNELYARLLSAERE